MFMANGRLTKMVERDDDTRSTDELLEESGFRKDPPSNPVLYLLAFFKKYYLPIDRFQEQLEFLVARLASKIDLPQQL